MTTGSQTFDPLLAQAQRNAALAESSHPPDPPPRKEVVDIAAIKSEAIEEARSGIVRIDLTREADQ